MRPEAEKDVDENRLDSDNVAAESGVETRRSMAQRIWEAEQLYTDITPGQIYLVDTSQDHLNTRRLTECSPVSSVPYSPQEAHFDAALVGKQHHSFGV